MNSFMALKIRVLTESIIYPIHFFMSLNIIFIYIKIVSINFLLSYIHITFSMISAIISILGHLKACGNPVIVFKKVLQK